MNHDIVKFIEDCRAENLGFDAIREQLIAAGWTKKIADDHIRYVKEGKPSEMIGSNNPMTASDNDIEPRRRRGPSCTLLIIGWLILMATSFFAKGLLSEFTILLAALLFYSWIIFMGGASRLEGSWMIALLTLGIGARWKEETIKIFAWIIAIGNLVGFIISAATRTE